MLKPNVVRINGSESKPTVTLTIQSLTIMTSHTIWNQIQTKNLNLTVKLSYSDIWSHLD